MSILTNGGSTEDICVHAAVEQVSSQLSPGALSAPLSVARLDELQLLLHGLDLGYLTEIITVSTHISTCVLSNETDF